MRDGFIKIAAATPDLHVADCAYNTSEIVKLAKEAAAKGAKLITFPELCLTGYTCGDLFLQETLLEGALDALSPVCREPAELALFFERIDAWRKSAGHAGQNLF